MSYSDYFDFSSGPELVTKSRNMSKFLVGHYKAIFNVVQDGNRNTAASKAFDKVMAGHDAETSRLSNTLKGIYDSYGQYASNYEGNVQPIIDALNGDIEDMQDYIGEYSQALEENKDTFLNGVIVDPNARRTRARYGASVAGQYEAAEEGLRQDMISQGLNPYKNTGATREFASDRARGLAGADMQAYDDWQNTYNDAMLKKQQGVGAYLGLKANQTDMHGNIMRARSGIGDMYRGIFDTKMIAGTEKAKGYESLASLAEARRAEALALGQQATENARKNADTRQQLNAKLTKRDKFLASGGRDLFGI